MGAHRRKFSAIDLFCGCGGLSLGLRRAGFRVLAAIDNDALSTSTYEENHKRALMVKEDIRSVNALKLMQELKLNSGSLDLMAGCPPCQGFSTLRTLNGGRVIKEPLNDLVYDFLRFVKIFMPKTVMMENVPALLKDNRLQDVIRDLEGLGYACAAKLFNAERFGVPTTSPTAYSVCLATRLPALCPPGASSTHSFGSDPKITSTRAVRRSIAQLFGQTSRACEVTHTTNSQGWR